eukprot:292717-Amphidinium_carterae.1
MICIRSFCVHVNETYACVLSSCVGVRRISTSPEQVQVDYLVPGYILLRYAVVRSQHRNTKVSKDVGMGKIKSLSKGFVIVSKLSESQCKTNAYVCKSTLTVSKRGTPHGICFHYHELVSEGVAWFTCSVLQQQLAGMQMTCS